MNIYVNYPKTEEEKNKLDISIAKFHASLVMDIINDLNLDKNSQIRIIKTILEMVKTETMK